MDRRHWGLILGLTTFLIIISIQPVWSEERASVTYQLSVTIPDHVMTNVNPKLTTENMELRSIRSEADYETKSLRKGQEVVLKTITER